MHGCYDVANIALHMYQRICLSIYLMYYLHRVGVHAAQALLLKAQTLQLHAPDRLPELAGPTLQLLRSRPDRRTALVAAARVLGTLAALPELEHALSEKTLLVGRLTLPQNPNPYPKTLKSLSFLALDAAPVL